MSTEGYLLDVWSENQPTWQYPPQGEADGAVAWGDVLLDSENGKRVGRAMIQADADGSNAEGYLKLKDLDGVKGKLFIEGTLTVGDDGSVQGGSFTIVDTSRNAPSQFQGKPVTMKVKNPKRYTVPN